MASALDPELPHPAAQRVRMELEESRGALRPLDDPSCPVEDPHDVISLDLFQGNELRWTLGDGFHCLVPGKRGQPELAVQLEHRSPGKHDRPLDDVLKLADVPRPSIP